MFFKDVIDSIIDGFDVLFFDIGHVVGVDVVGLVEEGDVIELMRFFDKFGGG